jgi:hypothetical protein
VTSAVPEWRLQTDPKDPNKEKVRMVNATLREDFPEVVSRLLGAEVKAVGQSPNGCHGIDLVVQPHRRPEVHDCLQALLAPGSTYVVAR